MAISEIMDNKSKLNLLNLSINYRNSGRRTAMHALLPGSALIAWPGRKRGYTSAPPASRAEEKHPYATRSFD